MARCIVAGVCLVMILALAACGGGNTADNTAPPPENKCSGGGDGGSAKSNKPDDTPKEDPDLWKKIVMPTPTGWDKLAKDGQAELRSDKYDLLLKPSSDFALLEAYSDKAAPHASSGTDEEWADWRANVSAVFIYNATKTKDDPVATLKKHGAAFITGFDAAVVREMSGIALYVHNDAKDKWAACVSNERGTYILVALVRNDDASKLMKPYPASIKPE
ncbi:MAG: hypothetical protein H6839_04580 [Planctomycetes bacterium]|nr:hypothetical protein [Planctomycetota bacterium]